MQVDGMHIDGFFLVLVIDFDFIAESPSSSYDAGQSIKAAEKLAFLHRGIDFQADFISRLQFLKVLAQRNLASLAVMPLE